LAAPFEPEKYHDTYRDNLQALIDAKIKGEEIVQPPAQEPAKVIDIMEALKQSLLISKKPATSATEIALVEAPAAPKKRGSKRASG
jgi:DNA end-binding protein Ku